MAVGVDAACLQITVAANAAEDAEDASGGARSGRRKGRRLEWRTAMVGTIAI